MNSAQTIFTLFYAIYFAVTTSLTGRFQPFDTPSMYKLLLLAWLRFFVSFILLNIVPLAYFAVIFQWLGSINDTEFIMGAWRAFWNMFKLLVLSLAGFGFYRIFFGVMLIKSGKSYFFYGTDLPKPVKEELDNRPDSHREWKAHVYPGIFWVGLSLALASLWL